MKQTALGAAVALVVSLTGGAVALGSAGSESTPPAPHTEVSLPRAVMGAHPVTLQDDPVDDPDWQTRAEQASGGAGWAARTYTVANTRRTYRVVAARTDLSGTLELAWAADGGSTFGQAQCTQKVQPLRDVPARVWPTIALCWRTSDQLSAYVLLMDPDGPVRTDYAATALDQVWQSVG